MHSGVIQVESDAYIAEFFENGFLGCIVDFHMVDGFVHFSCLRGRERRIECVCSLVSTYLDGVEHVLKRDLLLQWIVDGHV